MLQIAFYLSCGATACYLWGRRTKGKADSFNRITRVVDFKRLDELLKEKATNLLVVLSGKVASATPINCKHENGPLGAVVHEEDSTGLVKVVGAEFADGYVAAAMKPKSAIPRDEFFKWFLKPPEGSSKVVIYRSALDTGTFLTVVGEAARDEAGNLTIQKPSEHSFMVFGGEGSFDKMVGKLKSNSEFYFFCSKIFGTIAFAIVVFKGVSFIRRVLRERAENATDSDNEETP
ncbi:hypothetical protein F2Q68_00008950 [Brassica cretica]|uniref:RING-type E3 ubiquitin transferase n=1 Tax=Brassica cretica TaxID=69181 RepID=A0A8S9KU24_BRACR|nr:hypothetical protein F2Q68_00008950 [Brassica cretica]